MAKHSKRFQTGREIMRAYVPDYVPPSRAFEDQQLANRSGNITAQKLLKRFRERVLQKKLRIEPKQRGA